MKNLTKELLLLTTALSQLSNKDRIIQHFIESMNEIYHELSFKWTSDKPTDSDNSIEACTRLKNYGYILLTSSNPIDTTDYNQISNASQLLAVFLEKTKQEDLLLNNKNNLKKLVDGQSTELNHANNSDIAECSQSEQDQQGHLWYLKSIDKINRDIQGANDYENLLESEKRYSMVIENTPVLIWEKNHTEVNKLFESHRGEGVVDMEAYFDQYPKTVQKYAEIIKIVDLSKSALQRLHSPGEFPGAGLGIATVHRKITKHGGKLWSEGKLEKGTKMFLP